MNWAEVTSVPPTEAQRDSFMPCRELKVLNSVAELVSLFHIEGLCSIVKHLLRGVNSDDSVTWELISESLVVSTAAFHKKHDILSILLDRGGDIAELDRFEEA